MGDLLVATKGAQTREEAQALSVLAQRSPYLPTLAKTKWLLGVGRAPQSSHIGDLTPNSAERGPGRGEDVPPPRSTGSCPLALPPSTVGSVSLAHCAVSVLLEQC